MRRFIGTSQVRGPEEEGVGASVQDAHADLNDVARALGASTVRSIQYTGNGGVYAVGQSVPITLPSPTTSRA